MKRRHDGRDPGGRLGRFFTDTVPGRALVFLSLPLLLLFFALWTPEYAPPIFDAQVHYNRESWKRVSVAAVMNTAQELNVPWLLVGSTPNEGTWRLHRADPGRVIPMLIPGREREDRENWFRNPEIARYVERELEHGEYRGIGEFFLFSGQVDTPVVRRVVELARQRDLVLHARADPSSLASLLELAPDLRVLWAHAGMFVEPEEVGKILQRHPRVWTEISHRGDVAPGGRLDARWRELFLRYPEQVLLGSGTYTTEYWYQFRTRIQEYRGWLTELPPDVAKKIAYRNGLVLFGMDSPGAR